MPLVGQAEPPPSVIVVAPVEVSEIPFGALIQAPVSVSVVWAVSVTVVVASMRASSTVIGAPAELVPAVTVIAPPVESIVTG